MSRDDTLSLNWLVLACSMVLTIIGTAPAPSRALATSRSRRLDRFDRVANALLLNPPSRRPLVEDPPDEVKVAVVVPRRFGSLGELRRPDGAAPVNYGPVNLGPQAPFNGNYGSLLHDPLQQQLRPGSRPAWNGGRPTARLPAAALSGPAELERPYRQPAPYQQPAKPSDAELHDAKVTARYQDSAYLSFLGRSSMNQLTSLYMEASNLIDTRHVSPTSYQIRSQAAIQGLIVALGNPAFQQASGVAPRPDQIQAF